MDLGVVGLDGLVGGSDTTTTTTSSGFVTTIGSCSDPEAKHKWYGSGFLKQERSEDDDLRSSKLAKTSDADNGDISASKAMLLRSNATLFSDSHHHQQHQQMMLSFSSSSKPAETPNFSILDNKNSSPNATLLPYAFHHHPLSTTYSRNTGCYSSSGSNSMVHGGYGGGRGPFTPSQWMELEHQALIYKYITANVPIPSNLLIPIRKALDSAGLYNFSTGFLRPNALGWGGFHLGFSNNTDPEPGRCRRTDGKKWRCSRDAVVDQKYCERHMNRGRHRSRKPVEGQSGHALTGAATTTTTTTTTTNTTSNGSKLNTPNGNSGSSSLTFAEPKNMHNLLASDNNTSAACTINRMFMNNKENNSASERMEDGPALPMLPPTLELKPKESHPFMIHKQEINPYDESSSSRNNNEFGLVTCDSLLNPSQKSPTLLGSRSYGSSQNPTNRDTESQHSLRHFIDDCPKTQSDHRSGGVSWPELGIQSDRTQLSISLPLTSSDFMSFTTSSPTNEKLTLSPLRLSRELDPIQMGLGVGSALNNESNTTSTTTTRQANWIPITWESSMGGPLGEVLNLSSNNYYNNAAARDDQCASSALNLMSDGWDNSPPMGSSPTGVLQKTAFGSLSNSSAGSSPRGTDNKTQEVANSLCNDLLG